jgi:hypothetical protein
MTDIVCHPGRPQADVDGFITRSPKPADGAALCALMRKVSGVGARGKTARP